MTQRPPQIGAMPRGVIEIKEYWPPVEVKGVSEHVYAEIGYERELGADEVYQYELTKKVEQLTTEGSQLTNELDNTEYDEIRY